MSVVVVVVVVLWRFFFLFFLVVSLGFGRGEHGSSTARVELYASLFGHLLEVWTLMSIRPIIVMLVAAWPPLPIPIVSSISLRLTLSLLSQFFVTLGSFLLKSGLVFVPLLGSLVGYLFKFFLYMDDNKEVGLGNIGLVKGLKLT